MDGLDDRELCPDGACIGVIGPDGRCKECGALAASGARGTVEAESDAVSESDGLDEDEELEDELEHEDEDEDEHEDEDDELEHDDEDEELGDDDEPRELCSDDMCVGLIGQDGFCRECGKPGETASIDPRTRGLRSDEDVAEELEAKITKGDIPAAPADFADRRLCPDGGCIGVIGKDGKCKECGRSVR